MKYSLILLILAAVAVILFISGCQQPISCEFQVPKFETGCCELKNTAGETFGCVTNTDQASCDGNVYYKDQTCEQVSACADVPWFCMYKGVLYENQGTACNPDDSTDTKVYRCEAVNNTASTVKDCAPQNCVNGDCSPMPLKAWLRIQLAHEVGCAKQCELINKTCTSGCPVKRGKAVDCTSGKFDASTGQCLDCSAETASKISYCCCT